jgi:hypothetical protein
MEMEESVCRLGCFLVWSAVHVSSVFITSLWLVLCVVDMCVVRAHVHMHGIVVPAGVIVSVSMLVHVCIHSCSCGLVFTDVRFDVF